MLNKFLKIQFYCFFVAAFLFLDVSKSYAVYDGVRSPVNWNSSNNSCETGDFDFDPINVKNPNKDLTWELSNPVCISFMAFQGVALKAAGKIVEKLCVATNPLGAAKNPQEQTVSSIPTEPTIAVLTGIKIAHYANMCAGRVGEYFTLQNIAAAECLGPLGILPQCALARANSFLAATDYGRCCAAQSAYLYAFSAGMSFLGSLFVVAKKSYETSHVCGADWNVWRKVNNYGDFSDATNAIWRRGNYEGSYQYCLDSIFIYGENKCGLSDVGGVAYNAVKMENKYYREFLYGGREYEDDACQNPDSWDNDRKKAILGYTDLHQKYYMRGPGVVSGYACRRFSLTGDVAKDSGAIKSFECCKNRSQNTICVESDSLSGQTNHKFCKLGERCQVNNVFYDTYPAKSHPDFLCAKSFSVCPYNHLIGGGTEKQEFKIAANGHPTAQMTNYCQYMKHCAKVPVMPQAKFSDLKGAFISKACKNLKGDSQNVYNFNSDLLPTQNSRGFSAPIIQCFKETVENLLLNKAGHTECADADEKVSASGYCLSGYAFKENSYLNQKSFFVKVQESLQMAIKMALTMAIVIFGVMILLGGKSVEKKAILTFVLKVGLLMYFALGTGWQSGFVEGLLGSSQYISQVMMRVDDNVAEEKKDGCQFPRYNYKLDVTNPDRYKEPAYPPGKEYLQVWDMLDCKLARALGFGPDVSVPNLVKMIFAGFLTGGLAVTFFVAAFVFAFFLLSLILRAIHIFLLSTIAIVILIYISPITITLAMFGRTKSIFDNWAKQILGFSLQPLILFAYLGIFISIFDQVVVGDATYNGDGKNTPKSIVCSPDVDSKTGGIYCIFGVANLKTYSGLEPLGIGLPLLVGFNKEKLGTLIKAAFLMFIFYCFMDQVSKMASGLVGGAELDAKGKSPFEMADQAKDIGRGVQKRAMRFMKKRAESAGKSAAKGVSRFANLGKSVSAKSKPPEPKGAQDSAGKSDSTTNRVGGASSTAQSVDKQKESTEVVGVSKPDKSDPEKS